MKNMYDKEESWFLSASAALQPADKGHLSVSTQPASQSSLSRMSSSASFPTMRIKSFERDPIIGCLSRDAPETRDWVSHMHRTHCALTSNPGGRSFGGSTKFGVRDHTGRIDFSGGRYGVAEAFGRSSAEMTKIARPSTSDSFDPFTNRKMSQPRLLQTPSTAELDELLVRRSRARGRGGKHASVIDVVQSRWNVLYSSGSATSISMKTKD